MAAVRFFFLMLMLAQLGGFMFVHGIIDKEYDFEEYDFEVSDFEEYVIDENATTDEIVSFIMENSIGYEEFGTNGEDYINENFDFFDEDFKFGIDEDFSLIQEEKPFPPDCFNWKTIETFMFLGLLLYIMWVYTFLFVMLIIKTCVCIIMFLRSLFRRHRSF